MKRLMSALAAAALFSASLGMTAYAAKDEKPAAPAGYKDDQIKKGMAGAPAAVQALGLKCTVKNAALIGSSTMEVEMKKVPVTSYEVACNEGVVYVLRAFDNGEATSTNCLEASAVLHYECKLTAKPQQMAQVVALSAPYAKACQVSDSRFVGTTTAKRDLYEVACSGEPGFFLAVSY